MKSVLGIVFGALAVFIALFIDSLAPQSRGYPIMVKLERTGRPSATFEMIEPLLDCSMRFVPLFSLILSRSIHLIIASLTRFL